jgi:hypothetical protein
MGGLFSMATSQYADQQLLLSNGNDQIVVDTEEMPSSSSAPSAKEPAIYVAKFSAQGIDWSQMHTFLDSRGWGHGFAIVNGFNIGRYWPSLGPQTSLFVPGAVMKRENVVVLVELEGRYKDDTNVEFLAEPVLKYADDEDEQADGPPEMANGYSRLIPPLASQFMLVKNGKIFQKTPILHCFSSSSTSTQSAAAKGQEVIWWQHGRKVPRFACLFLDTQNKLTI